MAFTVRIFVHAVVFWVVSRLGAQAQPHTRKATPELSQLPMYITAPHPEG